MANQSAFPFDDVFCNRSAPQSGRSSQNTDSNTYDLNTAASLGDLKMVQSLLQNPDCNVDMRNNSGWTPLMYAAHYGHYNVIRVLLQNGADYSLQEPNNGKTALMLAASNGHTRCIEMLVCQGGAEISQRDFSGNTASFYATHYGHGSNKIIARLLAIRHLPSNSSGSISPPAVSSPTSGGSTLQHSNNTSGYKSVSGHSSYLGAPPSSPLSVFDSQPTASNVDSSAPGANSIRNGSPKIMPRAIFKSPSVYSQRRLSNGSSSSLSPAMQTASSGLSLSGTDSVADYSNDAYMPPQRLSPKSLTAAARNDSEINGNNQSVMEHSTMDQRLNSLQHLSSPSTVNNQFSPLCSTPQLSPTGADENQKGAQFSLHSSNSSDPSSCNSNNNGSNALNHADTVPEMYLSAISEPNTGISGPASSFAHHFSDIGMEVESMSMRRNNQLSSVSDNVGNISPLQTLRKQRPFELLNASTSAGSCGGSVSGGSEPNSPTMFLATPNENSNGSSRTTPSGLNGITFPAFGPVSALDVPSNMSALLQSVRLHQYVTLFRDWNVSLLAFLQLTESDLQSIGIHDRQHLAQLLHEQSRIRSLVYAPNRQQVSRLLQQVQQLTSENRVLKCNFKRLLGQLERVYGQMDRLDEQMVKLDAYTNELYAML